MKNEIEHKNFLVNFLKNFTLQKWVHFYEMTFLNKVAAKMYFLHFQKISCN